MIEPVCSRQSSSQRYLETTVKPLYQAIRLWMERCFWRVNDSKELTEISPDWACELCSTIGGDHRRNSKGWDPGSEQNLGTFLCCCRLERYCFRPSTHSINDGEQECMYVCRWIWENLRPGTSICWMGDLIWVWTLLHSQSRQDWDNKLTSLDRPSQTKLLEINLLDARRPEWEIIMNQIEHRPSHLLQNQGAEDTRGHVTEEIGTWVRNRNNR